MKRVLLLVSMLFAGNAVNAAFSEVISFGDSWSDNGNIYSAHGFPAPPYYDGNFSNGYMWTEYLAMNLGLSPATESEVGGHNYAWGGATTLASNAISVSAVATENQILEYLSDVGDVASNLALYTIWSGVNDNSANSSSANGIAVATRNFELAEQLLAAGANDIVLVNMPFVSDFGTAFNSTLESLVNGATSGNLILFDMLDLFNTINADPGSYGLTAEGTSGNCGLSVIPPHGTLSADCDMKFRVDTTGHFSATGHQIIADAVTAAVPLPTAAWLFLSSTGLLLSARRTLV